ncbi:hypothetical protein NQ318_020916 [Aromia moschata]|uniref:RING-type E3 ubiquitin transferase n=1 Tax=Aromia moschata TaxID=1265417 RepID=A0AAV8X6E8_9CUCU|nr:hypothetical protein NQ318_020916 [Aromia moschata]
MGARNYHTIRKTIPVIANIWYYCMTSLGNIQTLGEEYTGTIRIGRNNRIPSKLMQTLWLILFIGGEPLLERLLNTVKNKVLASKTVTQNGKSVLLKCIDFVKEQKPTLTRIHHSIFYTNGKYYNISNRIMGIRYVLLRQWLQDDTFTGSFNLLGQISLFYILFNCIHQLFLTNTTGNISENVINVATVSRKMCVLCAENIKSPCATSCGHIFCWTCIHDSLSYQKSCPICRESVNPSRIIFLQNYL